MSVYAFFDTEIIDAAAYEEYKLKVPPMIAAAGGKYLARGGELTVLEGDPGLHRVVLLEFPTEAAFQAWYDSPDYAPYQEIRRKAVRTKAFTLVGL